MSRSIPIEFRDLFAKRAYANLGTLRADGSPQVTPVWCDADGGDVVFNTARGRHQDRNIRNDTRGGHPLRTRIIRTAIWRFVAARWKCQGRPLRNISTEWRESILEPGRTSTNNGAKCG